ncbi:MAG: lipopolysaccharide assembly protein LapA domain-containing protein [Candidatus Rokuibacteriota bacterium]
MTFGYLVVALLAVAVTIFAVVNSAQITVNLVVRQYELPLSALVLLSLAAGIVVAGVPLSLQRWRLRARTRTLEARVKMLETAVEERTRAVLGQPPPPRPPTSAS